MYYLDRIKAIERLAYPAALWGMQDFVTAEDLLNYCEAKSWSDLLILSGPTWYFIATISTGEIIDLASEGPVTFSDFIRLKQGIVTVFKGRKIHFEAAESTSYRLVKRFNKIGQVLEDSPFLKKGIPFHKIVVQIN